MRCNICGKNIDNDKNICSECEKNMKNPKNINNNDIKSLGELLRTTWVYSIITFLITYFLLIFCISNVDFISKFFSGPNGLHYVFLIFLIQFLLVFIYIIKSIKKNNKIAF